jgi:hypothetical protein
MEQCRYSLDIIYLDTGWKVSDQVQTPAALSPERVPAGHWIGLLGGNNEPVWAPSSREKSLSLSWY